MTSLENLMLHVVSLIHVKSLLCVNIRCEERLHIGHDQSQEIFSTKDNSMYIKTNILMHMYRYKYILTLNEIIQAWFFCKCLMTIFGIV